MKKIIAVVLLLVLTVIALPAEDDTSLYIEGLESLIDENTFNAETSFSKLLDGFPKSPYADKASDYLYEIQNTVDNSGIVPFYLRNLATTTYTSMMLPILLEFDEGALSYGLTGLAGVGLGLAGSAWMAEDYAITSGLDWWIATNQIVSFGNYLYLNGIIDLDDYFDYDTADDIFLSGQLVTLNASLYGTYFSLRGNDPSEGKGAFAMQSYLWSNVYYWMSVLISEEFDLVNNSAWGMGITDLAFVGSMALWDSIRWTPMRTGLVTVGGLGGALMGWFSTMIIDSFASLDTPDYFTIIMGATAAGQGIATYLTRNMPSEDETTMVSYQDDLMIYPTFNGEGGLGLGLACKF